MTNESEASGIDQMQAAKDETEATQYREIEFRGEVFRVRYDPYDYLELSEAYESGNGATILRRLFGEQEYARLKALRPGITRPEASILAGRAMALRADMDAGESSGSDES